LDRTTGIAQSFVDTHIEEPPREQPKPVSTVPDMQQAPDFCCPCGGFLGWKQIRLGGKRVSRSYGDLRALGNMQPKGWAWEAPTVTYFERKTLPPKQQKPHPGTSAIEKLPPEVLGKTCPWMFVRPSH
jgi:hypothetical protein